ncbi:MAG: tyrosine-type recombinase/integrase [Planctomycetes bacterium]|nr:tyrosine-type recombinase/integrase [Planctomycetota bacterium]
MGELQSQVDEWLLYCRRSYSAVTVKMYSCVIGQLLQHIASNGKQLSSHAIENFLDSKINAGGSKSQFNTYRIVICSFCSWRQRKYEIKSPANKVPRIKTGSSKSRVLSQDEYKSVVNFVSGMDRDILQFIGNTGLRRTEFAVLKWGDIDQQLKYIRVTGKGNKIRIVPLNEICRDIILKYKRLEDNEPFQPSQLYWGPEGISWICRRTCRKTGMKKFGAHAIRHYFATQLIRKGVSIYKVSKLLGHASIKTTESIYIHLVPVDLYGITDVLD